MTKEFVTYKGVQYPMRQVWLDDIYNEGYLMGDVWVAPVDLYDAYKEDFYNNVKDIVSLDESIFFFCESGFLESDPTDEEIVNYLIENAD